MSDNSSSATPAPCSSNPTGLGSEYLQFVPYPGEVTSPPPWEFAIKIIFYIVAFLLDIVGNSIVILIVVRNRKMHVTTNVLIVNLAVADILVGLFCMWVHLGNSLTTDYPFGEYVCKGNTFIQVMAVTSSVLTLTVISVERFMAIVFPLRRRWSPRQTALIMTVTWLVAVAVGAPHLSAQKLNEIRWLDRHEVWCSESWPLNLVSSSPCKWASPAKTAYYTVSVIIIYIAPIIIMAVAYTIIVIKLIFRKAPGTHVNTTAMAQERAKRKVIKMLVIVLVVFTLCWTPQQAVLLWDTFKDLDATTPPFMKDLRYASLYVAYLNSALNPVLYSGFNENFRKGFIQAFHCIFLKKSNRIGPVTGSSARSQASSLTDCIPLEGQAVGSSQRRIERQEARQEAPMAVVSATV